VSEAILGLCEWLRPGTAESKLVTDGADEWLLCRDLLDMDRPSKDFLRRRLKRGMLVSSGDEERNG
jgi:hypothetical protein